MYRLELILSSFLLLLSFSLFSLLKLDPLTFGIIILLILIAVIILFLNVRKKINLDSILKQAHDIRTPLTSILGYAEALKDDLALDEVERERYLNILVAKSENLKMMIDEIFEMARLDAGDFELDFQVLDLAELIRECLIEFLPRIRKDI